MSKGIPLLLALIPLMAGAADPYRAIRYPYDVADGPAAPTFDRGYLILNSPRKWLAVYDRDGKLVFRSSVVVGKGTTIVTGVAIDPDGARIAAAVFSDRGNGVVFLDRSGKQTGLIETSGYKPVSVCFDEDHALWTLGWQDAGGAGDEYLVRKYANGEQIFTGFLRRSALPSGVGPGVRIGLGGLRVARQSVGALTYPMSMQGGEVEWLQMDLSGSLMGRWKLGFAKPVLSPGFALTASGALYTMTLNAERDALRVAVFDRASAVWLPTEDVVRTSPQEANKLMLLGADGDDLVIALHRRGEVLLRWLRRTPQGGEP